MPNWNEFINELHPIGSSHDVLRQKYIGELYNITNRNIICYYSGWLQKKGIDDVGITDADKNGFMAVINGLEDVTKGLDLILHTPGGDVASTESIVDYLYEKFNGDIRCFVPQMAMSAGTMIACACKEIWMGKHSSLGPIDPQCDEVRAHALLEEFQKAVKEIRENPSLIHVWQPIIAQYKPTLIGECEKVIQWSNSLIKEWLSRNMLENNPEKVATVLKELGDHSVNLAHDRHLSAEKCRNIGLVIKELESEQKVQDAVLSIHHIYFHTFNDTASFKIIENHKGIAFIQQAQPMMIPQHLNMGMIRSMDDKIQLPRDLSPQ